MLHKHDNNHALSNKLIFALLLTFSFAFVELVVGDSIGSLALVADAGHMFSDSLSLITLIGASLATKLFANNDRYTFGLGKIDIIAAIINIALVYLIAYHIFTSAIERFQSPTEVNGLGILGTAIIGLIVNLVVLKLLGELSGLGAQSAKLHLISDILGSIAAIVSGISILVSDNIYIDVVLSIAICVFLLIAAFRQLLQCTKIMLDAIPDGINQNDVERSICEIKHVNNVHDLHIWQSGSDEISLTAHIDMDSLDNWDSTLADINKTLLNKYNINHTTLQPETMYADSKKILYHPL